MPAVGQCRGMIGVAEEIGKTALSWDCLDGRESEYHMSLREMEGESRSTFVTSLGMLQRRSTDQGRTIDKRNFWS